MCSTPMSGQIRDRVGLRATHHAQLQRSGGEGGHSDDQQLRQRLVVELPHHHQLPRSHSADLGSTAPHYGRCDNPGELHLPARGGLHLLTGGLSQPHGCGRRRAGPAGQLNLTNAASNDEPAEFVSYRQLLFQHDEQIVIMGALQNAPGRLMRMATRLSSLSGPYLNAGSAKAGCRPRS